MMQKHRKFENFLFKWDILKRVGCFCFLLTALNIIFIVINPGYFDCPELTSSRLRDIGTTSPLEYRMEYTQVTKYWRMSNCLWHLINHKKRQVISMCLCPSGKITACVSVLLLSRWLLRVLLWFCYSLLFTNSSS